MSNFFWLLLCLPPEKMDLRVFIYAHSTTHFYFLVLLWAPGLWTWLLLPTQFFFNYFKLACKSIGCLCLCGRESRVLARTSFLAGNKFSNSDYKVTSGNAEKLFNCRSSLKIAHSTLLSSPVGSKENSCYPFTCVMYFITATFLIMLAGAQSTFSHTPNFRSSCLTTSLSLHTPK